MERHRDITTFYGLTNTNTKHIHDMIIYDDKLLSLSKDYQGYLYEKNILRYIPNGSDFKYIKIVEVYNDSVYIVRDKKDIAAGMLSKDGEFDIDVLNKKTKKHYSGYILLAPLLASKYSQYVPHFMFKDLSKCVKQITVAKKQESKKRAWISVEPCHKMTLRKCVISDSCIWKNDACSNNSELSKQLFHKLNKVMKPSKYYMFSEFQVNNIMNSFQIEKTAVSIKPRGFWFAIGDEWLQHLKKTSFWMNKYNYLYEIELNKDKVKLIDNMKTLQELSTVYGVNEKFNISFSGDSYSISITSKLDWYDFVKKTKTQGIIISPNLLKQYYKYSSFNDIFNVFNGSEWYMSWDVASGVVWDTRCITQLNLIYQKDVGHYL